MSTVTKEQKQQYIQRLVAFANSIGYGVDFETMQDELDADGNQTNPAGLCATGPDIRMIYIRKGKKPNGVITSLIHELVHALNQNNNLIYVGLYGRLLEEWECESVAHFVTQLIGIDRRDRTEKFVTNYIGQPTFNTSDKVKQIVVRIYDALTE
jgi:hypothetical protein